MATRLKLDFIRPVNPVENALIESFNGWLRDECLNVTEFTTLEHARAVLAVCGTTTITGDHTDHWVT